MALLGSQSKARLETCHPDLQKVITKLAELVNIVVVCGFRGQKDQEKAFSDGKSKLTWPESKHNKTPSMAVDIAPCNKKGEIDWTDILAFEGISHNVKGIAAVLGVKIRWGGDFKSFKDRPHYELI